MVRAFLSAPNHAIIRARCNLDQENINFRINIAELKNKTTGSAEPPSPRDPSHLGGHRSSQAGAPRKSSCGPTETMGFEELVIWTTPAGSASAGPHSSVAAAWRASRSHGSSAPSSSSPSEPSPAASAESSAPRRVGVGGSIRSRPSATRASASMAPSLLFDAFAPLPVRP